MTTHQYLQKLGIKPDSSINLAFMIGMVREVSPHYTDFVYRSTPIHNIYRWYNLTRTNPDERKRSEVLDYVVLNNEVYDLNWLSGANWNGWIKEHHLMMILVAPREELLKKYSEGDVQSLEDYCEKKIINEINAGENPWLGRK